MRRIIWDKNAAIQFTNAIDFISKESLQNAQRVKLKILKKVEGLSQLPEKYSPDKYKINNDGNHRAFEVNRYRISYYSNKEEIIITLVRHTSMKPKPY